MNKQKSICTTELKGDRNYFGEWGLYTHFIVAFFCFFALCLHGKNIFASDVNPILNQELTQVSFIYEGNEKVITQPVYEDHQRYYLPINNLVAAEKGSLTIQNNKVLISMGGNNYELKSNSTSAIKNGTTIALVNPIVIKNNLVYTNLSNLTRLFDYLYKFDYEGKLVCISKNKNPLVKIPQVTTSNKAYIRLEDVTFSGLETHGNRNRLIKMRAIVDMLYTKNVPFHVAWIPRFMSPSQNIDNDLMVNHTMANVDFVYTLDYMDALGGLIGLHGYTHADGQRQSANGNDFGANQNNSRKLADEEIWRARKTADYLSIPYGFFEFPHYEATKIQMQVAEEHFKYLYQPYSVKDYNTIKVSPNGSIYFPTPLDYVYGTDRVDTFLQKAQAGIDQKKLASFFFHPDLEFDSILISFDKTGYVNTEYKADSPLHRIVDLFAKNKYGFSYINAPR